MVICGLDREWMQVKTRLEVRDWPQDRILVEALVISSRVDYMGEETVNIELDGCWFWHLFSLGQADGGRATGLSCVGPAEDLFTLFW